MVLQMQEDVEIYRSKIGIVGWMENTWQINLKKKTNVCDICRMRVSVIVQKHKNQHWAFDIELSLHNCLWISISCILFFPLKFYDDLASLSAGVDVRAGIIQSLADDILMLMLTIYQTSTFVFWFLCNVIFSRRGKLIFHCQINFLLK